VYENKERIPAKQDNGIYLAIDPGLDNLCTIVSNCDYFRPFIIDGKEIKSINRYYNKKISTYTEMMKAKDESFASDEYTRKMWADRKNVLEDIAHLISARIIEIARIINANAIIIGHNDRWKDELPFKKPVKQNFAYIPYDSLYNKIEYKAAAYGITVVRQEESYTSKASFLDRDEIPTYVKGDDTVYRFSGKRIKRGLYCASDGTLINADVNGAYNILRKYLKVNSIDAEISRECMGAVIPPVRVRISELKARKRLLNK
jgi:putative transposase